jgi:hypothetical protein
MAMMSPASVGRAPVHNTSIPSNLSQAGHPVVHSSTGTHVGSGKNSLHPGSTKSTTHTHTAIHSTGGVATSGSRIAPQADFTADGYPTPGFGFDYVHYAAVHPQQDHQHFDGAIVPFIGGGIYLPTGGYYSNSEPPQEAAEDSQEVEPQQQAAEQAEMVPVQQSPASAQARTRPYPVPRTSSEYIFVRRDGSVFFAVAYSWQNGNLQYVTQDGFKKMASESTLDLDATSQFNEQRGLVFRSPA